MKDFFFCYVPEESSFQNMLLPSIYFTYGRWPLMQRGCLRVPTLLQATVCSASREREREREAVSGTENPCHFAVMCVCCVRKSNPVTEFAGFRSNFFLHKNKPIKLNTTFCCDYDFLIRISLNFGQSYIFYYLLSKHIFFPEVCYEEIKKYVLLFVCFLFGDAEVVDICLD